MRLEIEVDEFCSGEDERGSKVTYTRAFLLSVKESAVCKRLPSGFESSDLRSGYSELMSTVLDSDGDSQPFEQRSGSDFRGDNNFSQCMPKAPEYASSSFGPNTLNDVEAFQLNKSKNPYRPPHCYKVEQAKLEASSFPKTNPTARTCGSQEDKLSDKEGPARQIESKDSSDPVPAEIKKTADFSSAGDMHDKYSDSSISSGEVSNFLEASVARRLVDLLDCDAENVNASTIIGASGNEHCRTISSGVSLTANNGGGSFTYFANEALPPFAAPCEFEIEDTDNPRLPVGGCTGNDKPNQHLRNVYQQPNGRASTSSPVCLQRFCTGNDEPHRYLKNISMQPRPRAGMRRPICLEGFPAGNAEPSQGPETIFSVQRGALYMVSTSSSPETIEFPLIHGGFSFSSSIPESDNDGLVSSRVPENLYLYKSEENQSTFDNFWAEISAILRTEQELEPTPVASDKDADVSESEAELSLPDEDSLITVEDLIGPWCSKSTSSLLTACNTNRPPETSLKAPSFIDMAASETQQKQHYSLSYPQNCYADVRSKGGSRARYLNPKMNLDLYCNSCPCMNSTYSWRTTPTSTNFNRVVQYSVTQQPNKNSQQESGVLSSGLNCMGMLSSHPGVGEDQMSIYKCTDEEQGGNLPWPGRR